MLTFTQAPGTCMSDWLVDLRRITDDAAAQVHYRLISCGLGNVPFFVNEEEQRVELERVLLPRARHWHPQLCQLLDIEPAPSTMDDTAVSALEVHLSHVYQDHVYGLLEGTRQIVAVDAHYTVSTWLNEEDGYRAVVRSNTRVIARTERGLRTRLDATLAALWQLKRICQPVAETVNL